MADATIPLVAGSTTPVPAPLPPTEASATLMAMLSRDPQSTEALEANQGALTLARLGSAGGLFRVLRLKHPTTADHSVRVALGCARFATHLKLDAELQERIELAALLHDIGKLAMPDKLLNKPARLNEVELAVMERHLHLAVHIIEPFCNDPTIMEIIRHAGTWYDGTSPTNAELTGQELPIGSRVLAIQNAFDAMTTDTVYRESLSIDAAMGELCVHASRQFDPELVKSFMEMHTQPEFLQTSELVRRWVEQTGEQADSLWTLATPISQNTTDPQSIFQQRLLESMHDGVAFFDPSGKVVVWNHSAADLTGLSKESVHHKEWHPQIADMRDMEGNTIKFHACPVRDCLENAREFNQRMTITNRSTCQRIAVNIHLMPVRDGDGTGHGAIMILDDVSSEYSLQETVQTLHTKATRDALTNVNNRAEFDRRHAELIAEHSLSDEPLSLVICDIDRFKSINDTYGHQAGDDALVSFAQLIAAQSRDQDIVARYGGEEFVIICPNCDLTAAAAKAEKIRRKLSATAQPALNNTTMTASFGVTQLQPEDTPETMLKRADAGLYKAKETGRNRVVQDAQEEQKTTWKSWWGLSQKRKMEQLVQNSLRSSVPAEIVREKIRGFISDNHAKVLSANDRQIMIALEDWLPGPRRQNDRPVSLTLRIDFKDDNENGFGTLIDTTVFYQGNRERRMDDLTERADMLLNSFRGYLMAEFA